MLLIVVLNEDKTTFLATSWEDFAIVEIKVKLERIVFSYDLKPTVEHPCFVLLVPFDHPLVKEEEAFRLLILIL